MTTTLQSLSAFFGWTEVGLGRVQIVCQECSRAFELRLLQSALEAVCSNCGANAAFTRARKLEQDKGPLEVAKLLKDTGLLSEADHRRALKRWRRGQEALTDAIIQSGGLSKSLLLVREGQEFTALPLSRLINAEQIGAALEERKRSGEKIGSILTRRVLADQKERILGELPADSPQRCDLEELEPDPLAVAALPYALAESFSALPLSYDPTSKELVVATSDPLNFTALDQLAFQLGVKVSARLADDDAIFMALESCYGPDLRSELSLEDVDEELDVLEARADPGQLWTEGPPEVRTLSVILLQAVEEAAQAIGFEPTSSAFSVRLGNAEGLREVMAPDKKLGQAMVDRLKVLSGMDTLSTLPQRGHFVDQVASERVRFKVITLPTVVGESALVEFMPEQSGPVSIAELGFFEEDTAELQKSLGHGLVVSLAPHRGGATTTHHAFLRELAATRRNVVSLESSVRQLVPGVRQLECGDVAAFSRAVSEIRPDVLFIDPLVDAAGMDLAIKTVLGGGQAFLSVEAPSAAHGLAWLWHLGAPPELLLEVSTTVITQHRVLRTCNGCSVDFEPKPAELEAVGIRPAELIGTIPKLGIGCWACDNSGYLGSRALFEVVHLQQLDPALFENPNRFFSAVRRFRGLRNSALRALREGLIPLDEVRKVVTRV